MRFIVGDDKINGGEVMFIILICENVANKFEQ